MNLILWWHMHQPDYRTHENEFMLPWVYLHAIKDYIDMPLNIMSAEGMKANINITPVLIDQWQEYNLKLELALSEENPMKVENILPDRFLKPLVINTLTDEWRQWIIKYYKWANKERMIERFEPYKQLVNISLEDNNLHYLNDSYYFDLTVWFHLAWCGEWIKRYDPVIKQLINKGYKYTYNDRILLLRRISKWLKYGLSLYGQSYIKGAEIPSWQPDYPDLIDKTLLVELSKKKKGEYQVTLTPYYHPIVPLLLDINAGSIIAQITGIQYEPVELNEYPEGLESAKENIKRINNYWSAEPFFNIKAVWPSEGAISAETLNLFAEEKIDFCASGEEVLSNSLGVDIHKPISLEGRNVIPLYKIYKWKDSSIKIIFRDSELSDLIGFTYSKWRGDDAANNFVNKIKEIDKIDKNAIVSIIMDGENAWEYYFENGFYFLKDLYELFVQTHEINPITLKDAFEAEEYLTLDNIYPGSWVQGNLQMWIGERQKNLAWMLLANAKQEFLKWKKQIKDEIKIKNVEEQILKSEGSDWFWWLGEDNPLLSQSMMEKVFRQHLKSIYILMDKKPPAILDDTLVVTSKVTSAVTSAVTSKVTSKITSNINTTEIGGSMKRGKS